MQTLWQDLRYGARMLFVLIWFTLNVYPVARAQAPDQQRQLATNLSFQENA